MRQTRKSASDAKRESCGNCRGCGNVENQHKEGRLSISDFPHAHSRLENSPFHSVPFRVFHSSHSTATTVYICQTAENRPAPFSLRCIHLSPPFRGKHWGWLSRKKKPTAGQGKVFS